MTDVEFLDAIKRIVQKQARVDPDFMLRHVRLSRGQGARLLHLVHGDQISPLATRTRYRCRTIMEHWLPIARERIAAAVATKLTR